LRASRCAARIGGPSGSIVLGSVFRMDEWMEENGVSAADDEFVGRSRGANARRPQARSGSPAPSSEASAKRSQKEGLRPLQGKGKAPAC
jgi:hypothetical protein